MAVHEIERDHWREFLDQFSRDHRAWLATVERIDALGQAHLEVADEPLRSVSTDISHERVGAIGIEFQGDARSRAPMVRVLLPQRVRVDEDDGEVRSLEIADVNNIWTRIHFRVPAPPAMLDGIAPAELS